MAARNIERNSRSTPDLHVDGGEDAVPGVIPVDFCALLVVLEAILVPHAAHQVLVSERRRTLYVCSFLACFKLHARLLTWSNWSGGRTRG